MGLRKHHYVTVLLAIACLVNFVTSGSVSVCFTNCGQCKQMFGNYFHGQACAEFCLATNGFVYPDCNNPVTVKNFLKRLH
ncbi:eclosion hormone-like [Macrosteles quadrilineatus]|uniref:eclosion hormone-like n=1 Tax=Macrosteles quadrilineatus TaxID=74068 RepID=UPI0023E339DA|nr:eclosion hormone-like [Macrosteles quadrilineatus]